MRPADSARSPRAAARPASRCRGRGGRGRRGRRRTRRSGAGSSSPRTDQGVSGSGPNHSWMKPSSPLRSDSVPAVTATATRERDEDGSEPKVVTGQRKPQHGGNGKVQAEQARQRSAERDPEAPRRDRDDQPVNPGRRRGYGSARDRQREPSSLWRPGRARRETSPAGRRRRQRTLRRPRGLRRSCTRRSALPAQRAARACRGMRRPPASVPRTR